MTSFEISNTTERGVYTTLPTNEGSVGEIVGGIASAIVVLAVVLAIVIFVWKKRKKHRKRAFNIERGLGINSLLQFIIFRIKSSMK